MGGVRRQASAAAVTAGVSESDVGRVALVATEIASNVVKHAGEGGRVLVRRISDAGAPGVEILSLDRGRGINSMTAAVRDGYSTAGTAGTGLGATSRLADVFDLYSRVSGGTVVLAGVLRGAARGAVSALTGARVAAVCVTWLGEQASGDAWTVREEADGRTFLLVVDGLGHGPMAEEAAHAAVRVFREAAASGAAQIVERLREGLRPTRGAAVAVAWIDFGRELVRYAGVGNVAARIFAAGACRSLVSHHGTAGREARRIQEFSYPFPRGATLVMSFDGLASSWGLDAYPGLLGHHPATIAGTLFREFARSTDDATVVVLRGPEARA